MKKFFVIEDELHSEQHGEFGDLESAVAELRRRAHIPWDHEPNVAPCTSWRTCGRNYEIIEYEEDHDHWRELNRLPAMEISSDGVKWSESFGEQPP